MNFEDLQKTWQAHNPAKEITVNADLLLNEVRRNQQTFRQTIFWRDAREVVVAAILVPVFLYGGWTNHWTLYLNAFSCFVIGAYMLLDRSRQKRRTPDLHASLKGCATASLAEVCHQIWLLKNVVWWYLLPLAVPLLLFFTWVTWAANSSTAIKILQTLFWVSFLSILYGGIYWLNQFAVRKQLEPRREELHKMLAGLEAEDFPSTVSPPGKKPLGPLLLVIAVSTGAVIVYLI